MAKTSSRASEAVYAWAAGLGGANNNVVSRNQQPSCFALREFDKRTDLNKVPYRVDDSSSTPFLIKCYGCNKQACRSTHPVYVFSCQTCGDLFQQMRHLSRDLTGYVAVVVGARTKLGHQVVVKLLDAGANVVATTRYPEEALRLFAQYREWSSHGWSSRLHFFPESFDLDTPFLASAIDGLRAYVLRDVSPHVDIIVFCAAQTIRQREKTADYPSTQQLPEKEREKTNRYGNPRFTQLQPETVNSWNMLLDDLDQKEMEEVYRVNAVAPCMFVQRMLPLLRSSPREDPYVIHVHAREGLFSVPKGMRHIHTNMAKAALAMLTKCLNSGRGGMRTLRGAAIRIHGCNPGWISVDEYYEHDRPWIVPPLDEIDGAARVLHPVFAKLRGRLGKTRRHFTQLIY